MISGGLGNINTPWIQALTSNAAKSSYDILGLHTYRDTNRLGSTESAYEGTVSDRTYVTYSGDVGMITTEEVGHFAVGVAVKGRAFSDKLLAYGRNSTRA